MTKRRQNKQKQERTPESVPQEKAASGSGGLTASWRFWGFLGLAALALFLAHHFVQFPRGSVYPGTDSKGIGLWHILKAKTMLWTLPVIVVYAVLDRLKARKVKIPPFVWAVPAVLLIILTFYSLCAYFDYGRYAKVPYYINKHDFFHYYMGPKYSNEVGYLDLYHCAFVVDRENGPRFDKFKSVRNQEDYSYTPVQQVMAKKDEYKALFTDERWKEFTKDILFFRELMGKGRWQKALRDKGYNATPVWNMPAKVLTNLIPTREIPKGDPVARDRIFKDEALGPVLRSLLVLDLLLASTMFILIYFAFGWRVMLLAMIFFGTNFMMNQTHIKGSILRLDWVTFLVMATCLLKLKRYKTAGALMGYAAMSRIFPAVFLFGIGIKALVDFLRNLLSRGRDSEGNAVVEAVKASRHYFEFFIALVLILSICFGMSVVFDGGIGKWKQYKELISMHNKDIVGIRTGFKYVFLNFYRPPAAIKKGEDGKEEAGYAPLANVYRRSVKAKDQKIFKNKQFQWRAILAVVLLLSAFLVLKLEDYETIPYGFVLAFFMASPTFYYYVMLIVPLFLFAPKLEKPTRAVGLILLFVFSIISYVMFIKDFPFKHPAMGMSSPLFFWVSFMYMLFAGYIMFTAASVLLASLAGKMFPPTPPVESPVE